MRDVEQDRRENNFLWGEVLDNLTWFVSPRGDRFSTRRDPELEERGLDSIAFYIDRGFPREHQVVTKITGIDTPLQFWLDTHRNLLGSSHQVIPVDDILKQAFINMLLKRLYFITSGLLAKEQVAAPPAEGVHYIEYKRAHYRFLTSTDTRPITMESYGAQLHAREVREDYGIDIFREIQRRRDLGTLAANQFMTFVRETQPDNVAIRSLMPNELRYDPALVQIPV